MSTSARNQVHSLNPRRALTSRQKTLATSALIGASVLLLNIATRTADYYPDGITFALQIQKVARGERGLNTLVHQNHLLYNVVAYQMYRALHAAGSQIRPLDFLQISNALIGAAAIALFFLIAERETRNRYAAAVCSYALAVSAVWWKLSTDADAYMISVLLLLVCVSNLLGSAPRWFLAGLALAGAMLMHELAACFFPAALVAIAIGKRRFMVSSPPAPWY